MGLGRQLFQCQLGVLHGVALCPEGRIAQAGPPVFVSGTLAHAAATVIAVTKTAFGARATARITIAGTAIAAVARARTTARGGWCVFFHAGAVVATHSHHGAGWLGGGHRGRSRCGSFTIGHCLARLGIRHRDPTLTGRLCRCGCALCGLCLLRGSDCFGRLGLATQCGFQRLHGSTDLLGIARGIGGFEGLGGVQHHAVACAQLGGRLFPVGRLAIERLVNRLAESIPQLLFVLAVQRHGLRLGLPALLQRLDRIDAQHGRCAQCRRFIDHGVAAGQAVFLCCLQRRSGQGNGLLPLRLQFGKQLFAHMATLAPAVTKLEQSAVHTLPVGRCGVRLRPGLDLFDQRQALRLVLSRFGADLVQPGLDDLVCGVAGLVKFLPQGVVGSAALVCLFPLVTQVAQGLLHLAATQGLPFGAIEQCLGLGDEVFAHLVGAPALPALQLARSHQCGVHLLLQRVVDVFAVDLEHGPQGGCGTGTGLAMTFSRFLFQRCQGFAHHLCGLFHHLGGHLGLGGSRRFGCSRSGSSLGRQAPRGTQLIGPHGHGGQRRCSVFSRCGRLGHGGLEGFPDHQQLGAGGIQQRGEAGFHAHPAGVARQLLGLLLPASNVGAQQFECRMGIAPGLGREHFNALCEQHGGFALHLHAVLQVFDDLHAVSHLDLEQRQRLPRQGRTGLGRIALPSQGVCNIELGGGQQRLGFLSPFGGDRFLPLGPADFIQALAHGTGGPLVTAAQLLEDFLQLFWRGLGGQPVTDAGGALARRGGRKSAAGQRVERMRLLGFGRGRIHFRCVGHFAAGKKWKHGSNG